MEGDHFNASQAQVGPGRAAVLVASLIADLLGTEDDLDHRIDRALAQIGAFAGADRTYVIRIRPTGTFDNTHEWVAEGIAPGKPELQGIPVARMNPDLRAATEAIYIASVADLPETAPHRAHLLAQDVRSLLVVPMIDRGRRIGLVGFDAVRAPRRFGPEVVEVLSAFARVLTTVILRVEAEAAAERARRDLAVAEVRLRTTLAAVPDAVLDIDSEGRVAGVHGRMPWLFLSKTEGLAGATLHAALPARIAQAGLRCLAALTAEAGAAQETVELPADASTGPRWIEVSVTAHRQDADTQAGGAVIVLRDVTAEQRRASERDLLGEVAPSTQNLVVVTDARRRITWVNEAFERRTGWTFSEVRGRNPGHFMQSGATDAMTVARIRAALEAGQPVSAEILNVTRAGEPYWVELDIQPVRDKQGRLTAFHAIQTDISARKASAERMAMAARTATEAHERLVAAVDALPDAFAYFEAGDRLVLCNDRYRSMTRVPGHDDILGLTFEQLMRAVGVTRAAAGDIADVETWVGARLATHRNPGPPYLLRLLNGTWVKVHEQRTPDGGCVTMLVDVTAERSGAQRLEDTLDAAGAGVWEWNMADDRLIVDDRIAALLGHDSAAGLGPMTVARWREMMHPDDRIAVANRWDELRGDHETLSDHVYRVRHRNGHYTWVLSRGRMARPGSDTRIGVIIDISQRKRLEAELVAERDYLATLMQTSISAITALDALGNIVYANREAERLFGMTAQEIESRTCEAAPWRFRTPDGGPLASEDTPFARVMATGRPVEDMRIALERPSGTRQILSVNAAPVERPGSPIRVVCAIRDVTAEMAAEAAMSEALARAREATEAKSRFLASVSHEIRTPLNGVLGMAELLDLSLSEPRHREMVGVIRESGSLLLSVLNDILDMSKIEAGKLDLDIAPFVPENLAGAIEALHAVAARRKGIDLLVWTGAGLDRARLGDVHRIQQILHNLVGNAVKFTETGEVAVTLTVRPDGALSIRVRDTGPGMTRAELDRVFEEFEQADGTIARRHGGTGLGLSIVQRLVTLMQGEILADSAPGQGTDIRVILPLPEAPAAPALPEPAGPDTGASRLAGLRALVAEDNATNRLILRAMLDRLGVAATIVGDGSDAVAAWEPGRYDMVLLDITMPVMGGVEALAALREAALRDGSAPVPVVAITANAMIHQIAGYLEHGFDAHLAKPVSLGALESTLLRALAARPAAGSA